MPPGKEKKPPRRARRPGRPDGDALRRERRRERDRRNKARRYAEDPAFRERRIAASHAYWEANKEAIKARMRQRYREDAAHRAKLRERMAAWQRKHRLKAAYGISVEQYEAMRAEQEGRCAICREPIETLYVDHDHDTGQVRRLLCRRCNCGLGFFGDSPRLTWRATVYLLDAGREPQFRAPRTRPLVPPSS
jgi:hypothetical protein